ncbi:MAG: hypothetical protein M5U01_00135 [Ardenticatenaceae bacterium]|nr:hypothetical protein [Ardenticatenaceae bacterium]
MARANLFARALAIPGPGVHEVRFRYRPHSVVLGAAITVLALLASIGLLRAGWIAASQTQARSSPE